MSLTSRFEYEVLAITQSGIRAQNQDRVLEVENGVSRLLAVADGMGGLQAGDQAAQAAVDSLRSWYESGPRLTHKALEGAFQAANRAVHAVGKESGIEGETGTTLVGCVCFDRRYLVANAGDSRCYYVNRHGARCLTTDHSRVQQLVESGAMTPEAARQSPYRNELTNCLGEPRDIRVDLTPAEPLWGVIDEDCILLLCSDGLHGWVSDEEMHRTLTGEENLRAGCEALVRLALQSGSTDNITVAAMECGHMPRPKRNWWGAWRRKT